MTRHELNFRDLKDAVKNGTAFLLECERVSDGKKVMTVCITYEHPELEHNFYPVAELIDAEGGDPFQEYIPPSDDVVNKARQG